MWISDGSPVSSKTLQCSCPADLRCTRSRPLVRSQFGLTPSEVQAVEVSWCPPLVHAVTILLVVVLVLAPMSSGGIDAVGLLGSGTLRRISVVSYLFPADAPRRNCLQPRCREMASPAKCQDKLPDKIVILLEIKGRRRCRRHLKLADSAIRGRISFQVRLGFSRVAGNARRPKPNQSTNRTVCSGAPFNGRWDSESERHSNRNVQKALHRKCENTRVNSRLTGSN